MDSQDDKTLNARIRSTLRSQTNPTPVQQEYLRERLLERASQQVMLPVSPWSRLKGRVLAASSWGQDAMRLLGIVFIEDGRYHRAYYQRTIYVSGHNRKHKLGRLAGDYLEPLRYNMMRINVY